MEETDFSIVLLHPTKVEEFWTPISKLLLRVIEIAHGEVLLSGIKERLKSRDELCICVVRHSEIIAICVLGITEFETGKRVLQVPYCAGVDMNVWLRKGFSLIRKIARDSNCTHIRGCGRPGWEKALPELKKIRTIYECEV